MRWLRLLGRCILRGMFTGICAIPLVICGTLLADHPDYLQNPYWLAGVVAGIVLFILGMRMVGQGKILRGVILAFGSLGFTNGFALVLGASVGFLRHQQDANLNDPADLAGLAIVGTVLVLIFGFMLNRMEGYR